MCAYIVKLKNSPNIVQQCLNLSEISQVHINEKYLNDIP